MRTLRTTTRCCSGAVSGPCGGERALDADGAGHAAVLLWSCCSAAVCGPAGAAADDHAVLLWMSAATLRMTTLC